MTDETKNLFDAPWIRCRIEIEGEMRPSVFARRNHAIAVSFDEKDAARLARLPELYDALMEALSLMCLYVHEPEQWMCKKNANMRTIALRSRGWNYCGK